MTVSLKPKPRCLEGEFSQRWKGENKTFQELGFDPELVDFPPSYNYPELWPLKGRFQRWQPLSGLYEPLSLKFLKRFLCNISVNYYYYYSVWCGKCCATAVWRSEKALWNLWFSPWVDIRLPGLQSKHLYLLSHCSGSQGSYYKMEEKRVSHNPFRPSFFAQSSGLQIYSFSDSCRMYQHGPFMFNVTY